MKYGTGAAFRQALEQRLLTRSRDRGASLVRLRKTVVFDRLLARLAVAARNRWVLKGALALDFRFGERTEIVAHFLNPGGGLYLAEGHPCAHVFDDEKRMPDGMPGYCVPYFGGQPLRFGDPRDYADDSARLENATTYEWLHPLGEIVTSLLHVGLSLKWLHEHDSVPWRMFEQLVKDANGMYHWPDQPWFPLAFSLRTGQSALPIDTRSPQCVFPPSSGGLPDHGGQAWPPSSSFSKSREVLKTLCDLPTRKLS